MFCIYLKFLKPLFPLAYCILSRHQQVSRAESERLSESVIGCDRESSTADQRRLSFPAEDEIIGGFLGPGDSLEDLEFLKKSEKELTHFSEEGIADMDIPDHLLEELDFLDNITSCDKVENYLMLSEYEQNLIKEIEGPEGVSGISLKIKMEQLDHFTYLFESTFN